MTEALQTKIGEIKEVEENIKELDEETEPKETKNEDEQLENQETEETPKDVTLNIINADEIDQHVQEEKELPNLETNRTDSTTVPHPQPKFWYSTLGSRFISLINPKYQYDASRPTPKQWWYFISRHVFFFLGPILAFPFLFDILSPGKVEVSRCCAVLIITSVWWTFEPIPIAIASISPCFLFPLFGIATALEISATYFNDTIFLLIGSYMIAIGIEEWNLHTRISLVILYITRGIPIFVLGGFIFLSFFFSMWLSNTSTSAMLLPMANTIIDSLGDSNEDKRFGMSLMIAIPLACSIGGTATLIGTTTNLVLKAQLKLLYPAFDGISFLDWMIFTLPLAIIFIVFMWLYFWLLFVRCYKMKKPPKIFKEELKKLGWIKYEEVMMIIVFMIVMILWLFRELPTENKFGWGLIFKSGYLSDGTVALLVSSSLFVIPSWQRKGDSLLSWKEVTLGLPWNIFLMIGAGFALSKGFEKGGLSDFIGKNLAFLGTLHPFIILILILFMVMILTNFMSNTAIAVISIPILAKMAPIIHQNPLLFTVPVTIISSYAFLLPIGTPPNAIAYSFGKFKIYHMFIAGIGLSFVGLMLIYVYTIALGGPLLQIEIGKVPIWAGGNTTSVNATVSALFEYLKK